MKNYMKFLGIFVLAISLGFAYVPGSDAYDVEYLGIIEVDASSSEWNDITKANLKDDGGTVDSSYFKVAYTGSEICFYFVIYDSSKNGIMDYVNIGFDDEEGIFYSFARDGSGDIGDYEADDFGISWPAEVTLGWKGEVCIPYAEVGLVQGSDTVFSYAFLDSYDNLIRVISWPTFDDTADWYSTGNWAPPGWCSNSEDCEGDEACFKFTCFELTGDCGYAANHIWINDHEDCPADQLCVNRECTYLPASQCGYIEDHEIVYYECCEDSDCEGGEVCSSNICEVPAECTENADCEDDKYCSGESCISVPTGSCGYVSNHLWQDYECCENADCGANKKCVSNECETAESTCEGTLALQLVKKTDGNLKALVSGINYCAGKLVEIKENNCEGETLCSFESGNEGGNCDLEGPNEQGWHVYVACVDLNGDGTNEYVQGTYLYEIPECESEGCDVLEWNTCECEEGKIEGMQTGICLDNCNEELEYLKECGCELANESEEITNETAHEAIIEAEEIINELGEAGENVSEAEEKLEQAQEAFEAGDYALAKELAEDALELAAPEKEEQPSDEDYTQLLLTGGLILLGIAVIYLLYDKFYGHPKKPGQQQPYKFKKEE